MRGRTRRLPFSPQSARNALLGTRNWTGAANQALVALHDSRQAGGIGAARLIVNCTARPLPPLRFAVEWAIIVPLQTMNSI